jgi:hypothetical protein
VGVHVDLDDLFDAGLAAMALTNSVTWLSDRTEPVSDRRSRPAMMRGIREFHDISVP